MRVRLLLMVALLGAVPVVGIARPCLAAGPGARVHHAGLLVQFGDGSVRNFCVEFTGDSITGLELLRRSGLPLVYQDYGGDNVAVCNIAGEGCNYPKTPCFCQCLVTSDCIYWGYYTLTGNGPWRFSDVGPGSRALRDGEVDGWRWTRQSTSGGGAPAAVDAASVCARGQKVGLRVVRRSARGGSSPLALAGFASVIAALIAGAVATKRRRARV